MWRERNWAVTPKALVVLVPVPVKCSCGIWRSPFSQKQRLLIGHLSQLSSFVWIMQWTDLLNVGVEGLLNLGIVRQDINAMWNLAPHDISISGYLIGKDPLRVSARGLTYLQHGLPDVVFLTIDYPGSVVAHIHVSWLDPQKVRRMTIVGTHKMVVYDDVSVKTKVQIYDNGISHINGSTPNRPSPAFGEYQFLVRSGDLLIPQIDFVEPERGVIRKERVVADHQRGIAAGGHRRQIGGHLDVCRRNRKPPSAQDLE